MSRESLPELLKAAVAAVKEAGEIALRPPADLEISTKSHRNDLVTVMDKYVENFLAEKLASFSTYPLLGEEGHRVDSPCGRIWVLDPIDGTLNYVYTGRDWAISLALYEDGVPVLGIILDPTAHILYTAIKGAGAYKNGNLLAACGKKGLAEGVLITSPYDVEKYPFLQEAIRKSRGLRRYGSAALECAEVASGKAAAFVHSQISPWDVGAALVLAGEVGIKIERLDNSPFQALESSSIIYAWPQAAMDLQNLALLAKHTTEHRSNP